MTVVPPCTSRHSLRHRAVGWCSLAVYAVAAFGFPVPEVAGGWDGTPYPCQHHNCGCRSARQCWTQCCCFSQQEKLAWAAKRGLTPLQSATPAASSTAATKACCQGAHGSRESTAISQKSVPDSKSFSTRSPTACCSSKPTVSSRCCDRARKSRTAPEGTLVFTTFQCRGLGSVWMAIAEVVAPPPPQIACHISLACSGSVYEQRSDNRDLSYPPTAPPG